MFGALRRRDRGQPLGAMLFYELCWGIVDALFILLLRMRRHVDAPIPQEGPLLVIANHQSYLDPPLIGLSLRNRHLVYLARRGLFKNRFFAMLLRSLNAVPLREEGGDTAAMRTAIEQLKLGRAVVIFPEGTRSPHGGMVPFKRGAWVLLARARCDVLPVAVEGCYDAWPRERPAPRLFRTRVASRVGRVIPHEELAAMGPDAGLAHLAGVIDKMRLELRAELRAATNGRYPAPGAGDKPLASGLPRGSSHGPAPASAAEFTTAPPASPPRPAAAP